MSAPSPQTRSQDCCGILALHWFRGMNSVRQILWACSLLKAPKTKVLCSMCRREATGYAQRKLHGDTWRRSVAVATTCYANHWWWGLARQLLQLKSQFAMTERRSMETLRIGGRRTGPR